MSDYYASTLYSLMTPDTSPDGSPKELAATHPRNGTLYHSARRAIERQDAQEQESRLRYGLVSWVFAVKDGERWCAGVMLASGQPGRFRRKLSLPVFDTDRDAMAAAERWRRELEKPR